jgi:hypothetical protein
LSHLDEGDPMPGKERYIYGIGRSSAPLPGDLAGLHGAPVERIAVNGLAAFVSAAASESVRPERRHLLSHQDVLVRIAAENDILPMAFGTIGDDAMAVDQLLTDNAEEFERELERIAGRIEMAVKLRWQGDDIFRFFVDLHPSLRRRRDACFDGRREPGQIELLELGRHFESLLNRERGDKLDMAVVMLRPSSVELKVEQVADKELMFSVTCLVARESEEEFGEATAGLAKKFGDSYEMQIYGPWPPYSFINLNIS